MHWALCPMVSALVNVKEKMGYLADDLKVKTEDMAKSFINLLVVFVINTVLLPLLHLWVCGSLSDGFSTSRLISAFPPFPKDAQMIQNRYLPNNSKEL